MGDQVRLWQVGSDERLAEIRGASLDLESRLQEWLAGDISILDPGLLVIGREVATDFGGSIDILCIDGNGDLVIVELKRDKTPREVTAQALDYASWIAGLSAERVASIAREHLGSGFESVFSSHFESDFPETVNGDHRVLVVGSEIDSGSERIISYLSDAHGVNINAATFQYFRLPDGSELLARVFLIEPSEVELKTRTKGGSKRRANLTYEELQELATQAGVQELYDYAVSTFDRVLVLRRNTSRSSIRFEGNFDGSRRVILSLIPGESRAADGLRYQVYKNRLATLVNLSVAEVEQLMPVRREDWTYSTHTDPDWHGYEGFITDPREIDRLAEAFRQAGGT